MPMLRKQENEEQYKKLIAAGYLDDTCRLCQASSLKNFKYWRIIRNNFPYDLIAEIHDMIVPRRHVVEDDLLIEEQREYGEIKTGHIGATYTHIIEPTLRLKSIPGHFHLHLIVAKD